jgi:hypothetical protein
MRSCLLLFLYLISIAPTGFTQNKLALLVAVGKYPDGSKLRPIASVNDVKFIKAALQKNGFDINNIDTLINAKATKAAILGKLTDLATKAKKDDIVVIHFGCHGQQIRDQRTVELGKDEDDGYDEAFLPYDAKGFYNPGKYQGENHLRDDELGPKLAAIRKSIGPNGSLLVLLDACHSGTGTRADDFPTSRGEPVPFPDPENPYNPSDFSDIDDNGGFFDDPADSLSNMVVISGSGPHQENKQMVVNNEEVGSLSYSFFKAINDLPAESTYGLLFQKIKTAIQAVIPDQVPLIEGNATQVIFSGKYLPKENKNYIRVGVKELPEGAVDSLFILNLGKMDNMKNGATGSIYLAGKEELVARGVIRKTEHFRSIGSADKLLKKSEAYEFRPDEENYGSLSALIEFDKKIQKTNWEKQVKENFIKYPFIKIAPVGDYLFTPDEQPGSRKILLEDRNKKIVWSGLLDEKQLLNSGDISRLPAAIKNSLRIKYLRTMPDGGELGPEISAEIIPEAGLSATGEIILSPGDIYTLKINNNTNQKLFYTVLDIYPDDRVEITYPYKGKPAANYSIEKNNFVEKKLKVSDNSPSGAEFLKIIVSKESMDQMWDVFEQTSNRSNMNSFENMMNDLFSKTDNKSGTRADVASFKAEEIGIVTVRFNVKNNQKN